MDNKNKCVEKRLLTEFARHPHINGSVISMIMKQLDSYEKKKQFLSFMIDNRGVMLKPSDFNEQLKLILEY